MTTIGKLKELLSSYPDDMTVGDEQNRDFVHIVNADDRVIISTTKPLGRCNRTGTYVYPTSVEGYSAFCPALDEDLVDFEWTKLEKA